MATFAIDSPRQQLRATGVVNAADEWVANPVTKKNERSGRQAVDETGVPLWEVEVQTLEENFGKLQTVTSKCTVPSPTQPVVAAYEVVNFHGLEALVRVNRNNGQLITSYRATGIAGAQSARKDAA